MLNFAITVLLHLLHYTDLQLLKNEGVLSKYYVLRIRYATIQQSFSDDDAEETEEGEHPFASLIAENESLYIDDPKKALKGFYEREGKYFYILQTTLF